MIRRKERASGVEPLLPVGRGRNAPRIARGVRAGRWVFVNGALASDEKGELAREVAANPRPLS